MCPMYPGNLLVPALISSASHVITASGILCLALPQPRSFAASRRPPPPLSTVSDSQLVEATPLGLGSGKACLSCLGKSAPSPAPPKPRHKRPLPASSSDKARRPGVCRSVVPTPGLTLGQRARLVLKIRFLHAILKILETCPLPWPICPSRSFRT